jgi:beta-xylosidase
VTSTDWANGHQAPSGSDDWAAFRDKAGIVPLVKHATVVGEPYWWAGAVVKPWYPVTMRGAWSRIQPFTDYYLRDFSVLNAPDGYYYLTGTDMNYGHPKLRPTRDKIGITVWRSKDMKNWESMGLVWRCDDHPDSKAVLDRMINKNYLITYDIEMHYLKGTYWLIGCMQAGNQWADADGMRVLMLRSTSGKPEGPYEWVWKDKTEWRLWTPNVFQDDDGKCYIVCGGRGDFYGLLKDDLSGLAEPLKVMQAKGDYEIGEGGHIQKIDGYYFWTSATLNGPAFRGDSLVEHTGQTHSYDLTYSTAKSVHGPWSPTRAVPWCGNTRFFQDKQGHWWAPFMGGAGYGPWWDRPAAYPVTVKGDRIIPERGTAIGREPTRLP